MRLVLWILLGVIVLWAVGSFVWFALNLPPLSMVVSHGFPPAGGPTGRRVTIEGVTFVEIGAGYFRMGSWSQCDRGDLPGRICARLKLPWGGQPVEKGDEVPVHWVRIRRPYWIAETEVTNAQYERFDPGHGRAWREDDAPVVILDAEQATLYCAWLSRRAPLTVRLPSEAEWENACRAGSAAEYCFGDDPALLPEYAWFRGKARRRAHEVRLLRPNSWGLYDMHGNVMEWCEDSYHEDYRGSPPDAQAWTEGGVMLDSGRRLHVRRGGFWGGGARPCRSADRGLGPICVTYHLVGFRPAATSDP